MGLRGTFFKIPGGDVGLDGELESVDCFEVETVVVDVVLVMVFKVVEIVRVDLSDGYCCWC